MTNVHKASLFAALLLGALAPRLRADQWTAPTPAELSMTSIPEVPGAPAVILFREQTTDDELRMFSFYVRLKVLTEAGKDKANVEIPYVADTSHVSIDSVSGRTIQPDGSVTMFTGKPYDKLIVETADYKRKAKVFTLPAVQVGSIIEYRFKLHYDDGYFIHPDWYIQSDLFLRKAHYSWRPTNQNLVSGDGHEDLLTRIAWTPILPVGAKLEQKETHVGKTGREDGLMFELNIADVPPVPEERYMPPLASVSYRVLFYYTGYKNGEEFWKGQGKRWSNTWNKFIGPNDGVRTAVKNLVGPTDNEDQKLRKIYAAVQQMDNTDFSREHTQREDKAEGLKAASTTDDILARKRGTGDQLTALFIAMARAAGMKAYLFTVSDRDQRFFLPIYLSLSQLDDNIAVVKVDGKDMTFDPGQQLCPYGQLAWKHTLTGGLRQNDEGAEIATSPGSSYKDSHTSRIADLALNGEGIASGVVKLTYTGAQALSWRQKAFLGDDTATNTSLRESLERMLPGGMEVRVTKVEGLTNPEKPLVVVYDVKGAIGSPTGKRLLVTSSLFESNARPSFPQEKRDLAVDLEYPSLVQDAVRIKYPADMTIESLPPASKGTLLQSAAYTFDAKPGDHSITLFRNVTLGGVIYVPKEYPDLRTFYSGLETRQAEPVIFTRAAASSGGGQP